MLPEHVEDPIRTILALPAKVNETMLGGAAPGRHQHYGCEVTAFEPVRTIEAYPAKGDKTMLASQSCLMDHLTMCIVTHLRPSSILRQRPSYHGSNTSEKGGSL